MKNFQNFYSLSDRAQKVAYLLSKNRPKKRIWKGKKEVKINIQKNFSQIWTNFGQKNETRKNDFFPFHIVQYRSLTGFQAIWAQNNDLLVEIMRYKASLLRILYCNYTHSMRTKKNKPIKRSEWEARREAPRSGRASARGRRSRWSSRRLPDNT